jgi:hypothetical protein
VACSFGLMSRLVVFAFVGAGAVLAALQWRRQSRVDARAAAQRWEGWPGLILVSLCGFLALVNYFLSIDNLRFQPNDDLIAYFPFARQILDAGTLFDPFSTRRVMSFGGQSLLHALVLAGAPAFRLHMFDDGICLLIAVLLVAGDTGATRRRWPLLAALLVLITVPDVRINTYPEMSGVVVFYGLYRTLAWLDDGERPARGPAAAAIIGLVAIAACTLRSNYIAVAVPLVALSYVSLWLRGGSERGSHMREALCCAALSFAFLAPWMFLSWRSSGTPLFPIIHGNFNDAFAMLHDPRSTAQRFADLTEMIRRNSVFRTLPLLIAAGFLLPDRGRRSAMRVLLVASLFGWVLLVWMLWSDVPSHIRYVFGFMIASALAVTARMGVALDGLPRTRRIVSRIAQVAAVVAVIAQLYDNGRWAILSYGYGVRSLPSLAAAEIQPVEETVTWKRYDAMQNMVPKGERLLVMVDFPYLLNFSRNEIYNIDTAAAVSPPPGWPYFHGPASVENYLRSSGIRYLAFVTPETAVNLFRRDVWQRELAGTNAIWHAHAPFYLDVFANIEAMARTHEVLYYDGSLVLFDLARPRLARAPAKAN